MRTALIGAIGAICPVGGNVEEQCLKSSGRTGDRYG
jgi:hypothetical protein